LHDGTADKARLLQHQVHHFRIAQFFPLQAELFETGTADIEHVGSRPARQQFFDFFPAEGIYEKIPFAQIQLFLQEKLSRFAAGGSAAPAVKKNLHVCLLIFWRIVKK
jgi:hypothetical protein